jgi:hypothetical protein
MERNGWEKAATSLSDDMFIGFCGCVSCYIVEETHWESWRWWWPPVPNGLFLTELGLDGDGSAARPPDKKLVEGTVGNEQPLKRKGSRRLGNCVKEGGSGAGGSL